MPKASLLLIAAATFCAFSLMPDAAFAYVGPGAGLSAIGTLFSLVAAVFLGIVGFVWYPIKRLLRRKPQREATARLVQPSEPPHKPH